eukprot:gene19239-25868_t
MHLSPALSSGLSSGLGQLARKFMDTGGLSPAAPDELHDFATGPPSPYHDWGGMDIFNSSADHLEVCEGGYRVAAAAAAAGAPGHGEASTKTPSNISSDESGASCRHKEAFPDLKTKPRQSHPEQQHIQEQHTDTQQYPSSGYNNSAVFPHPSTSTQTGFPSLQSTWPPGASNTPTYTRRLFPPTCPLATGELLKADSLAGPMLEATT